MLSCTFCESKLKEARQTLLQQEVRGFVGVVGEGGGRKFCKKKKKERKRGRTLALKKDGVGIAGEKQLDRRGV